ncbi:Predicted steroid reductase [Ceraceosorus bombacis]|uniref:Predicted steroid reductase n=1 Tax=Ceraceosorus bombacis TaxID=401625 RepID=A0A0P1BEL6_9BASI|nr:Predicted steroid reductase [Ceraceosorus bombacis]
MFVAALDPYYLGLTAIITVGWQAIGFAIAYGLQIDTITDFWSAINFFALALITLLFGDSFYARNIISSIFVMLWAVRLGAWQLFRMLKMGGDSRFDEMRAKPLKFAQFWIAQALWVWTVSTPVVVLNSPAVSRALDGYGGTDYPFATAKDIIGIIFWLLGFACEAFADLQKYTFKQSKPPRGAITDTGLWHYSRRPNYFGEILLWLGIYLLVISPASSSTISRRGHDALLATVISPLFTFMLLMFLSGLPLSEKPSQEKSFLKSHGYASKDRNQEALPPFRQQTQGDHWERYKAFRSRTSLLIPIPPAIYQPLPRWIKCSILCDWPMYNFDEKRDGPKALQADEKKQQDQSA